MLHTDARFAETVEAVVGEIEARTDAEVIVVATTRSGSYRDLALLSGAVAAWLGLCFVLYSPLSFSGLWLPLELPLLAAGVAWLVDRSPQALRRLASPGRRRRQAQEGAHAAFHQEVVYGTRRRTGILVYVSALEDQVVVMADGGIEAAVPQAAFHAVRWGQDGADPRAPGDLQHFVAGLRQLGEALATHVPALEGDNPNELGDAPRIRS